MLNNLIFSLKEKLEKKLNFEILISQSNLEEYDLTISLFKLVKTLNKKPDEIANIIIKELNKEKIIKSITLSGCFLNLIFNRIEFSKLYLVKLKKSDFKIKDKKQVIVIDYSSPNIAKSFSVGHLRSTVIGNSLKLIYNFLKYKTISVNHLGDWGTQFGNLIAAYKMWHNEYDFENNKINSLQEIYQRFHEAAKDNENLINEGRKEFSKLEKGDPENLKLLKLFKEISLVEFKELYSLLNINFDSYDGEAFYNDKMNPVLDKLRKDKIIKISDGCEVVEFNDKQLSIITKSDKSSSYMLRDLAAVSYREKFYHADKILYVVGSEQKLHFEQLQEISKMLNIRSQISHVSFGLILHDGKKMSTRKGTGKSLKQLINDANDAVLNEINSKNPNLANKENVAMKIALSALIFFNLKNDRILNINFNQNEMLNFQGLTGPYLQYTIVRIKSILSKANYKIDYNNLSAEKLSSNSYFKLLLELTKFILILEKVVETNEPSHLAKYLLSISQRFNKFYAEENFLKSSGADKNANFYLLEVLLSVLQKGINLLGLFDIENM